MYRVEHLVDRHGRDHFEESVRELDISLQGRISRIVGRFEGGNFGDHRHLGSGLFESRLFIQGGGGLRIYFGRQGKQLILLILCGKKANQQADIDKARSLWVQRG